MGDMVFEPATFQFPRPHRPQLIHHVLNVFVYVWMRESERGHPTLEHCLCVGGVDVGVVCHGAGALQVAQHDVAALVVALPQLHALEGHCRPLHQRQQGQQQRQGGALSWSLHYTRRERNVQKVVEIFF